MSNLADDSPGRKRTVAGIFDRAAPMYDSVAGSYFSLFGPRLIAMADIRRGATVLDVACGKGATLVPAAEQTGLDATVVGVDISREMVRSARMSAINRRLTNVGVAVMDAENLAVHDACVDTLICAFSLHFFPDPSQAAREFARVVRPDGNIALSEWGAMDDRWSWEAEIINQLPVTSATSGSFDTSAALESLLSEAHFHDVQVTTETADVYLADEEEWWIWKWSYSFRYMLEQLDAETLDRFKRDALKRVRNMRDEKGVPLTLTALVATGRKRG